MHKRAACLWRGISSFAEKQGFPIIITVCVAIITASAVWASPAEDAYVSPTPPVNQAISAAQLLQESLRSVATTTPTPTPEPAKWQPPLEEMSILQPYNDSRLVQNDATGVWQTHAGLDLSAKQGTPVHAMADGVVLASGQDTLKGAWLRIDHGEIDALYAGMIISGDYIAGDKVDMGDTLGYVGNGLMGESALAPHLHIETTRNGAMLDPSSLFESP